MSLRIKIPPIEYEYTEIRIDVFINNQFSYSFYHSNVNDLVELNNLKPGELVFIKVIPINAGSAYDPSYQSSSYRIPLDADFFLRSIYLNGNRFEIHNNTVNLNTTLSTNKINLYTLEINKTFDSGYYEIFDGENLISTHKLNSSLKFAIDNYLNKDSIFIKVYISTIGGFSYNLNINLNYLRAKFKNINHSYSGTKNKKLMMHFYSLNQPQKIEIKIHSDKSRAHEIFSTFVNYETTLVLNDFCGEQGYVTCDLYDDFGLSDTREYNYILIPS